MSGESCTPYSLPNALYTLFLKGSGGMLRLLFKPFAYIYYLLQDGQRIKPTQKVYWIIGVLAVFLTMFEMWFNSIGIIKRLTMTIVFTSSMFTMAFLTSSASQKMSRLISIDYVFALLSFVSGVYFYFNSLRYADWIPGLSAVNNWDLFFGIVFFLLTLELMRRCVGFGLSIVVFLLIAYVFVGHLLSGTFSLPRQFEFNFFIERMIIGTDGIFGTPTYIAATYAFMFVLFGKLFQVSGGGQFFFDIAAAVSGKRIGGPAKVAVISSGMFGMVSGSPVSDVVTTGSVTIPMMKKMGYSSKFAAAVESTASTGGALMPPIMGAAVFMMAEFTAIRYVDIAISAVFAGLLYYFSVYMQVHFHSLKKGLVGLPADQIIGIIQAFRGGWQHLLSFGVLIGGLVAGYTPAYVATVTIITVIIVSWFKKETRLTPKRLVKAFIETCYATAPLVAAVAAAGIVIGSINLTGMAGKFSTLVMTIAGDNMFLILLVSMITCIILGMGMPVINAYILSAVLLAPSMVGAGIPTLEAHLFLIYYAAMSAITPPVAVACYAAASIAEVRPMSIATRAVRLGIVAFTLPYFFVYNPGILLQGPWNEVVYALIMSVIGVYLLACAMEGWFTKSLVLWQRIILGIAGVLTIIPGWLYDIVAFALIIYIFINIKIFNKDYSEMKTSN